MTENVTCCYILIEQIRAAHLLTYFFIVIKYRRKSKSTKYDLTRELKLQSHYNKQNIPARGQNYIINQK